METDSEVPLQPIMPQPPVVEIVPVPAGFWRGLDFFLQCPEQLSARLVRGIELPRVCRLFLLLALVNSAIYGAVMGASNLFQGAPMPLWQKLALIPLTGVKVPVLFLLTLAIVLPPIYVSNAFSGARLSFSQLSTALLGAVALGSTLLASLATVACFFSLTTLDYHFIKLLHVLFFAYAGLSSLSHLHSALDRFARLRRVTPAHLKLVWLLLYAFVGTQLAWVLRPFIASPNEPFEVLRDRTGSFYESVGQSARHFVAGTRERK